MNDAEKIRAKKLSEAMKKLGPHHPRVKKFFEALGLIILAAICVSVIYNGAYNYFFLIWIMYVFIHISYGFLSLIMIDSAFGGLKAGAGTESASLNIGSQIMVLPFNAKDWNNLLYLKWLKHNTIGAVSLITLLTADMLFEIAYGYATSSVILIIIVLVWYQLFNAVFLAICIIGRRKAGIVILWVGYFLQIILAIFSLGSEFAHNTIADDLTTAYYIHPVIWLICYALLLVPFAAMILIYNSRKIKNKGWLSE